MSNKYQNISKENSEISKIILESFYKYNREKNNNLEIKELFNKKDSKDLTEIAIIENNEKSFFQKLFDKIKWLFKRK